MKLTKLNFSRQFVLQDDDGEVSVPQLLQLAEQALLELGDTVRFTIDARSARATLVGLAMAQLAPIDIALARESLPDQSSGSELRELAPGVLAWLYPEQSDAQPRLRLFTSGTTGRTKSALYSMQRLVADVRHHTRGADAVWLLTYEPASFAGLQVILTAVVNGARLLAPKRNIHAMCAALRSGATHVSATPSFWRALLATLPGESPIMLKAITLGGEPASQPLLDSLVKRFPQSLIRHIYASTEAGVGFTVSDGKAGFPTEWLNNSVDGVELRIQENELEIRSNRGMMDYVGNGAPKVDGWLRTGDLVEIRADRVLFQGRRDSVVNVGGSKILPEKVESLLEGVDGVADLRVVARTNAVLGHILEAHVCARTGADPAVVELELKARAASVLPPLARPARYRFVDSVVLESGKKGRKNVC